MASVFHLISTVINPFSREGRERLLSTNKSERIVITMAMTVIAQHHHQLPVGSPRITINYEQQQQLCSLKCY